MNAFAYLVLLGWVPLSMAVFATLPIRRAILAVVMVGSLFLPILTIELPGLPDFGKEMAINLSLLFGIAVFARGTRPPFRFAWCDVPMLGFVLSGAITAWTNDHGLHDSLSELLDRSIQWGVPYLVGRTYFGSREHTPLLLWAIFLGGLVYLPLCWYEIRMSPQLHHMVYGAHQHDFVQTMRGGGYRPMVFTRHGLELSIWIANAMVAGYGLWKNTGVKHLLRQPMAAYVAVLGLTLLLCKSTGATFLGLVGLAMLAPRLGSLLRLGFVLGIPTYLACRSAGIKEVEQTIANFALSVSSERAADSLADRLEMESLLLDRAWSQPAFGISTWEFNTPVTLATGEVVPIVCDSMWIIAFTCYGFFGLVTVIAVLWQPIARILGSLALRDWSRRGELIPLAVIMVVLLTDSLVNTPASPYYLLLAGSLSGVSLSPQRAIGTSPQVVAAVAAAAAAVPLVPRHGNAATTLQPRLAAPAPARCTPTQWLLPRNLGRG